MSKRFYSVSNGRVTELRSKRCADCGDDLPLTSFKQKAGHADTSRRGGSRGRSKVCIFCEAMALARRAIERQKGR